jgi:phage/plasmid-associated DNA primase
MFFFQGTGGNGKSVLNSLALAMLGAYGLKIPSKFFLQESDMKPMPEIANAHNVRFCLSQEPNNKKLIVPNVMKEWTGDMVYSVRGIYSSKTQITLKQTQVMEVNDMPNINETTEGVHRRMKFTRFECKAVE